MGEPQTWDASHSADADADRVEPAVEPPALVVDRAAQLRELVALVDRGFLTGEEFERQRRKVLGA